MGRLRNQETRENNRGPGGGSCAKGGQAENAINARVAVADHGESLHRQSAYCSRRTVRRGWRAPIDASSRTRCRARPSAVRRRRDRLGGQNAVTESTPRGARRQPGQGCLVFPWVPSGSVSEPSGHPGAIRVLWARRPITGVRAIRFAPTTTTCGGRCPGQGACHGPSHERARPCRRGQCGRPARGVGRRGARGLRTCDD